MVLVNVSIENMFEAMEHLNASNYHKFQCTTQTMCPSYTVFTDMVDRTLEIIAFVYNNMKLGPTEIFKCD